MYIVTGGAGFIGSWIVNELNKKGIKDILIVDKLRDQDKYKNLIGLDFEDYIDKDDFISRIRKNNFDHQVKVVLHMGACSATTELDADYLISNNYQYSKTLVKWSLEKEARFIYASSAATYGDGSQGYSDRSDLKKLKPLNPYGFSKSIFDTWLEKNHLLSRTVGLKFFNVFGPNEDHKGDMRSVVKKAFEQIKSSKEVSLFKSYRDGFKDGEQLRDFIYIKDVINIIFFFLESSTKNGIFNVGTGVARSFNDLAKATFRNMNLESKINYIDMPEQLIKRYQYFTQAEMGKLFEAGYLKPFMTLEEGVMDYVLNYLLKE